MEKKITGVNESVSGGEVAEEVSQSETNHTDVPFKAGVSCPITIVTIGGLA